ncbi:hypothetical protein JTE90_023646 [Oedothorax gibbosus]|uniref:Major facilitator superfamily (MFS) profile domain-containing protein n=1 Tax=Oedothorax gibbosus TaxID=931172 RepID=A0AAV6UZ15_9ARAC|nr:hypothetical protein JTE90_023646 [Oedothorax gibbosus]
MPFLLSWLMIAYAPSIIWIYAGRLLAGFSTGMCSVAVPAYIIEIATIRVRGLLGSFFQISFSVGVLISMTFVMLFRWSWLAIVGALLATHAVLLTYFIPESPSWLLAQGRNSEALESWRFLRGNAVVDSDQMKMESELPKKSISILEFRKPELYKPIALSIGLVFFQQFSGISALMSYTVEIFERAESSVDPSVAAAIVAVVQVIATVIAGVLVDKVGRNVLYLLSGIFVTVGLIILGIFGIVSEKFILTGPVYGSIPLIGFIIFVASFSLGYGPIPYLMTPEFVPMHSRSFVLSIAGVFSSLFLFIVTKTFDDLRYFVSDYGVYWVYGFFSILGCLFCWLCFPETKYKSVIQIQQSFKKNLENPNLEGASINNEF